MSGDISKAILVELLSTAAGKIDGLPVVVMTVRYEPGRSFATANLAFSREQADRLRHDLALLIEESASLGEDGHG